MPKIYASTAYDYNKQEDIDRKSELITPYVDEHYPLRLYGERTMDDKGQMAKHEHNRKFQSMLPFGSLFTLPNISQEFTRKSSK